MYSTLGAFIDDSGRTWGWSRRPFDVDRYGRPFSNVPLSVIAGSLGLISDGNRVAVNVPLMRVLVALVMTTVPELVAFDPPQTFEGLPVVTEMVRAAPVPNA